MLRPTFVVAEPEPEQALSTRKLVLETAKFNVITAHSSDEAKQILRQFPNANALIVHEDLPGSDCAEVVKFAKQQRPAMPAIALSISDTFVCDGTDHRCSTHNPDELLQLLRQLFGDPRQLDESNQSKATRHGNKNQRPK
jgi:DNA-binding NtrC family response regulator